MASTPRLTVGTLFAEDFRIVSPLAEGGMGSVYRAEQVSTRKMRAVKVVHGRLLDDERSRARFVREATVAASIASEHVVEVIAAGIDRVTELPYLVMELLDGGDLAAVVRHRGRLEVAELGALMRQLCHGLAAAHAARVIHRDLKPENIFVAYPRHAGTTFTVKILDFGIAKVAQESKTVATLTGTVGSPLWMSPEQINNDPLGPQTDVWALGLLAFWALTGQSYWRTARAERLTVQALFAEQLFRALEPASVRAEEFGMAAMIPPGFDAWFGHCVTRAAADRFSEAGAAWAAFAQAVDPGARLDVTLLPPQGEAWESTTSRMPEIESTLADRNAVDSAGLSDTSLGASVGAGARTLASTSHEPPTPPAGVAIGASTEFAPVGPRPPRRWPWLLAPVAALALGVGVWQAWPREPTAGVVTPTPTPPVPEVQPPVEPPREPPVAPTHGDTTGEAPPTIDELPPPATADEQAAVAVVRPMTTQPSFSAAALDFVGWSADGSRFVIDATYPDRTVAGAPLNRLRLVQVHDALSGAMVSSFLVEREAAPEISERDRLARAAAEAEPYGDWSFARQELRLGAADATARPPVGDARIEAVIEPTPPGSQIDIDASPEGFAFRWTVGALPTAESPRAPHLVLHWAAGTDRWELLDVPLALSAGELLAMRGGELAPTYAGTVSLHWSPHAQRIVAVIRAKAEHVTTPEATFDARWFLRASGPQIRVVDGGAGQRRLRHAAWSLQQAGLPIAAADLDHETVENSRAYVRASDPAAADLAARINRALDTELPSALLTRAGWTQVVLILGPDFTAAAPR